MSSVQAAIDGVTTALQAVNWVTAVGQAVTVDKTPERVWTLAERRAGAIVYVHAGGSTFELSGRNLLLLESPTLYLTTMRHIGIESNGQLNAAGLAAAEAVARRALVTAKDWIVASERFAPIGFEKPERYSQEQALNGDFVSSLGITLLDGVRL